jgi:hypothetical protein
MVLLVCCAIKHGVYFQSAKGWMVILSEVDQYVLGLEERNIFKRRPDSSIQSTTTPQQGEQQVRC